MQTPENTKDEVCSFCNKLIEPYSLEIVTVHGDDAKKANIGDCKTYAGHECCANSAFARNHSVVGFGVSIPKTLPDYATFSKEIRKKAQDLSPEKGKMLVYLGSMAYKRVTSN